jgi:hypothetical protein
MPANTSPDNIVYPVAGDVVVPLRGWFSTLASSVQAALTDLRADAVKPVVPNPINIVGNPVQAVTATGWADLPGIGAATLVLSSAAWVQITVGAWVVATGGSTRVSANVTGATTLGETQLEVGGVTTGWGQVLYADNTTGSRQASATRIVRLNAGSNTIRVRAYQSGTGSNSSNYTTLTVAPLYWD